jgi:hypothetical protein
MFCDSFMKSPIPVAARSMAWIRGRSLAGIAGRESRQGHGYLSVVSVVCCQVEVSATGRSLVQRSSSACGVCKYDSEASIIRRPWSTRRCCAMENQCMN